MNQSSVSDPSQAVDIAQSSLRDPSLAKYGRRLLPQVVDETADAEPERPIAFIPRTAQPRDGWKPVTFGQIARAVNRVAYEISNEVGELQGDDFPTIAYIGPNDMRYIVLMLACIKAHCKALFISPRNSSEGQRSLFTATDCDLIYYADPFGPQVETWLRERPTMRAVEAAGAEAWLQSDGPTFMYARTFEEARWEPVVVLHTSGSTGHPKPITIRHGSIAITDRQRRPWAPKSSRTQSRVWQGDYWADNCTQQLLCPPLFHVAGWGTYMSLAIWLGRPVTLPIPNRPLNAQLLFETLLYSGVDAAFMVPSIIEELSRNDEAVSLLKNLRYLAFAGGNLAPSVGNYLVARGVKLSNRMASTEIFPYPMSQQDDPALWQWLVFNDGEMGAQWRHHGDDVYELVIRRKNPNSPEDQQIYYTFPDLETEWSTNDLYRKHPTLPDYWMYHGRADNIIVLSNGEKLNPVTIEDTITGHPDIKGAIVVGARRFQPALILEPAVPVSDGAATEALISKVWPLVEQINKETVAHGRIAREMITVSKPDLPFVRAGKGTVIRAQTVKAYENVIDIMYRKAETSAADACLALELDNTRALTESLMNLFKSSTGNDQIGPDTDFFQVGVDSLQVTATSKLLLSSLEAAGVQMHSNMVASAAIYGNPTPRKLALYLDAIVRKDKDVVPDLTAPETQEVAELVSKYTRGLPAPRTSSKLDPADKDQCVLVTGTTGSLGAYLLDQLISCAQVMRVIALNRDQDGGRSRQASASASRGLSTDFAKVNFLHSDLSRPDWGIAEEKYNELMSIVDRIIHNAWPVNFNIGVSTFEPSIQGVRHLIDFAAAAKKRVPITFVSSISTVGGWTSPEPVPEERIEDLSLAKMGYGRSKLAASLILDAAWERSGVPTASVRVGQIAGPRGEKGVWNRQEYLPSLIASSVYLGVLPQHLGTYENLDWTPVEDIAALLLDLSGVTTTTRVSAMLGYFHGVNPHSVPWSELVGTLKEYYGERIKGIVSLEEWVSALEKSIETTADADVDRNPGLKLLHTYQGMLEGPEGGLKLAMKRTLSCSPTMRVLGPVTRELVKNWCRQWSF